MSEFKEDRDYPHALYEALRDLLAATNPYAIPPPDGRFSALGLSNFDRLTSAREQARRLVG